jgi:hypothetical protein
MSTYTPIATQTMASDTATVTFSSLPQNYTDIIAVVNAKWSSYWSFGIRFNNDSGSNYSETVMQGDGSNAGSFRNSNANRTSGCQLGPNWGTATLQFQNYANGATFKTGLARSGESTGQVRASTFLWRNTAPVTSITFITSGGSEAFGTGSTITLYGVAAGNSSAKASGGNIVTTDGSYWYHTFTSSGTFIPNEALTADYLVVAGGGAGGKGRNGIDYAGGGGAGGLRSTVTATGGGGSLGTALSLSANTVYQAIVGAGGAAGNIAGNGSNSTFSTITSIGGGRGGGDGTNVNQDGGSGGGASLYSTVSGASRLGGSGTANQGYNGGNGTSGSPYRSGGGGGAGAAGTTSNGGNGVAVSITGSSITYAGGGGGGASTSASAGTGGTGGGGAGSGSGVGANGTVYLGAGGGGGYEGSSSIGGNGGSGVIIIRYAV